MWCLSRNGWSRGRILAQQGQRVSRTNPFLFLDNVQRRPADAKSRAEGAAKDQINARALHLFVMMASCLSTKERDF